MLATLALSFAQPMAAIPEACPATPAALPAPLAGWRDPVAARAGTGAADAAVLVPGRGVRATLAPMAAVRFAVPPAKPGAAGGHGGVFAFTVAVAGRYRVALGTAAWIDVVAGGVSLPSVAHAHGPACSGIRKMVDFDLRPGRHWVQVAGSAPPVATLLVAPLPSPAIRP